MHEWSFYPESAKPEECLCFTYMGFKTVDYEIGKRVVFDIMTGREQQGDEEVAEEVRPKRYRGWDIPEREQSFSQHHYQYDGEFEGLSFTSADQGAIVVWT